MIFSVFLMKSGLCFSAEESPETASEQKKQVSDDEAALDGTEYDESWSIEEFMPFVKEEVSKGVHSQEPHWLRGYFSVGSHYESSEKETINRFQIHEAALYGRKSYQDGFLEAVFDLAFSKDFNFLRNQSQLFGTLSTANGWSFRLGQFDSLFAFYAGRQDALAHRSVHTGLLQSYVPRTQLGFHASYLMSEVIEVGFFLVNSNEENALISGTDHSLEKPDFGFHAGLDYEYFSLDLSFQIETGDRLPGIPDALGYLASLSVYSDLNRFDLGLFSLFHKPAFDSSDNDFGIGTELIFHLTKKFNVLTRFEVFQVGDQNDLPIPLMPQLSRSLVPTTLTTVGVPGVLNSGFRKKYLLQGTLGLSYFWNKDFSLRMDYSPTLLSYGNTDDLIHYFGGALVVNF